MKIKARGRALHPQASTLSHDPAKSLRKRPQLSGIPKSRIEEVAYRDLEGVPDVHTLLCALLHGRG